MIESFRVDQVDQNKGKANTEKKITAPDETKHFVWDFSLFFCGGHISMNSR